MTKASPPSCPEPRRAGSRGWAWLERARLALLLALACGGAGSDPAAAGAAGANAAAPPLSDARPTPASPGAPRALGTASSAAPPSASPAPSEAAGSARAASRATPGCRVVGVSGSATRQGGPLHVGDRVDGTPLELAAGARLHLVHTASARAWSLEGPARLLPCDGAAEELVLAHGTLRAEPGSGVRPGAEVWIGTPYGAVRYADAGATLNVGERQLGVRVAGGRLWFTPLGGSEPEERPLAASATFPASPYRYSLARALERCGRDASAAEQHARGLLAPSARPLGERAAEHVRARQRAHASCVSARAAALAQAPDDARVLAELARYDAAWRGVPQRPAAEPPAP